MLIPGEPGWSYLLLVLLICGVTFRVTRFVTADRFPPMEWLRERLVRWIAGDPDGDGLMSRSRVRWAELPQCDWCVSIYVAGATTVAADVWWSLPAPVFVWLTASGVAGVLGSRLDQGDDL